MQDLNIRDVNNRLFIPNSDRTREAQLVWLTKLYELNELSLLDTKSRVEAMREMFSSIGTDFDIAMPFFANWGGHFTKIGDHFRAGDNLTLIEEGGILIFDNVSLGSSVTIITRATVQDEQLRAKGYMVKSGVEIGSDSKINDGVLFLPGSSVGDHSVVLSGAVVRDKFPPHSVLSGNPARVIDRDEKE